MIEATSCGGVVIFRGKILLLYKNYKNKYEGWVFGVGSKIFSIAGPVILYGIVTSWLFGLIYWIMKIMGCA